MNRTLAATLVFVGAPLGLCFGQDTTDDARELMRNGDFGSAYELLVRTRGEGEFFETDLLIAQCACHIPARRHIGLEMFQWVFEQRDVVDASTRARYRDDAEKCGYRSPWVRAASARSGHAQATFRGSGKMFHILPLPQGVDAPQTAELSVATDALEITSPRPSEVLAARLKPIEPTAAVQMAKATAGPQFIHVVGTTRFVIASAGKHTDDALLAIGADLDRTERFLTTTLRLPQVDGFITVYLVPSVEDLRAFAKRVHGVTASNRCIGYSYPADRSIVAVIPGARIGTLRHELVHTLVTVRFPELAPWLDEGLASLYEESTWRDSALWGLPGWRQEVLQAFWDLRPTVPRLVGMNRDQFNQLGHEEEQQAVTHAAARTLLLFIQDRGGIAAVFDAFRPANPVRAASIAPNDPVERLAKVLGVASREVDQEFVKWFRSTERPAAPR